VSRLKKQTHIPVNMGISLMLTVFIILCMILFSVLSLSGALKDNHRATIVGEQSFGKGLVQEINKLPDEAGMNITIQRYLTPSGQDINKKGITPDVVVELKEEHVTAKDDVQLKKAIEVLKEMTCLVQRNGY